MVLVPVEQQFRSRATVSSGQASLQLVKAVVAVIVLDDVRIPPKDHGIVGPLFEDGVATDASLAVVLASLDVVVIAVYLKSTLEQRVLAIPVDVYASPADVEPFGISGILDEGVASEDAMFEAIDGLGTANGAVVGEVGDGGAIGKDVVIGLKRQADACSGVTEGEGEVI